MIQEAIKKEVMDRLRREILAAEGLQRQAYEPKLDMGLPALASAFPDQTFPTGCIHEFISPDMESAAATAGFITALLGHMAKQKGPCIWVSRHRRLFAPALLAFGLPPDQVIFIHPDKDRDLLWTTEQALKCRGLAAVIADVPDLDLTASRRLQLAVEQSRVTGLLHRYLPGNTGHTACVARWQIKPLSSETGDLPGMGAPRWQVNLLKVRNGRPGTWIIDWAIDHFELNTQFQQSGPAKIDHFELSRQLQQSIPAKEVYVYPKAARA